MRLRRPREPLLLDARTSRERGAPSALCAHAWVSSARQRPRGVRARRPRPPTARSRGSTAPLPCARASKLATPSQGMIDIPIVRAPRTPLQASFRSVSPTLFLKTTPSRGRRNAHYSSKRRRAVRARRRTVPNDGVLYAPVGARFAEPACCAKISRNEAAARRLLCSEAPDPARWWSPCCRRRS